jgi:hypothetical protein
MGRGMCVILMEPEEAFAPQIVAILRGQVRIGTLG